jgi:general secretion pathway protein C
MRLVRRLIALSPPLVIVVAAALVASISNHVISASLLVAPPARAAGRPAPPAPPPARDKEIAALVERNLFCHDCGPAPAATVAATPAGDGRPPLSALPLALVATVTTREPARGTATIVGRADGRAGLYAVGEVIPGAGALLAVRASGVDFMNPAAGRVERLELLAGAAAPGPTPAAAPPPARRPPENELVAAVEKGVRKLQEGRYEVDRALIDRILGDPTALMTTASVTPAVSNGKAAGFRLRGSRGGGLYAALGLKTGDTIRAVNGQEITGPDSALAAYASLRQGGTVALSVDRDGQPMKVEYAIR